MDDDEMLRFQGHLKSAKNIVFLTGAGVSAESGVPTVKTFLHFFISSFFY